MIQDFTIFETSTGKAVQAGRVDTDYLEVGPGETVLYGVRVNLDIERINPITFEVESIPITDNSAESRVFMELTPRQLFLGMAAEGFCTAQESLECATTGQIPLFLESTISSLSEPDQINARITWASMSVVKRMDPLTILLVSSLGVTEEDVDNFFITYSQV